jgi:DNA-binding NarL/FixJ family response regulator
MHNQRTFNNAAMDAGARYVLKDDQKRSRNCLVLRTVVRGGIHLSQTAYRELRRRKNSDLNQPLSPRQVEALPPSRLIQMIAAPN